MRAVAIGAATAILLAGCGGSEREEPQPSSRDRSEIVPVKRPPRVTGSGRYLAANLTAPTKLRATPGGRAVARLTRRTRFGSASVYAVVRREGDWLGVLAPERGNGRIGWIPVRRARLSRDDTSVHISLSKRRVEVRRHGRTLMRTRIAIGKAGTPTPIGRFAVTDRLLFRKRSLWYGCCALALSARQTRLAPGWRGGDRIAIHGTMNPGNIGGAVSNGCLRADDRDARRLIDTVPLGAPVFIRA